jgi:hypothetical protein
MRTLTILFVVTFSAASAAPSISDEFESGYGGVPWGIELPALMKRFPGGYQIWSTVPGGLAYVLNLDDPVFGISRRGLYVLYGIGTDRKVTEIDVQIPYDQTAQLISTITSRFGPVIGPEVKGVVTSYHWPAERGFLLGVRTTIDGTYGLTTLSIHKRTPTAAAKAKTGAKAS